jgi:4-hydroxy-4-methyl-2-oxoglutarate aldolase
MNRSHPRWPAHDSEHAWSPAPTTVPGDDDGVVFIASDQAAEVLTTARQIAQTERDQARKIQTGQTLRQQTAFGEYLARRAAEPSYTFRRHLRQIGGAIEE